MFLLRMRQDPWAVDAILALSFWRVSVAALSSRRPNELQMSWGDR